MNQRKPCSGLSLSHAKFALSGIIVLGTKTNSGLTGTIDLVDTNMLPLIDAVTANTIVSTPGILLLITNIIYENQAQDYGYLVFNEEGGADCMFHPDFSDCPGKLPMIT